MIKRSFPTGRAKQARSVYLALCEIASDKGKETFVARINEIAQRAGVHYDTAARRLNRLAAVGLIAIERRGNPETREHWESRYTMLKAPPLPEMKGKVPIENADIDKEPFHKRTSPKMGTVHSQATRTVSFLELSKYSAEEREVIELYHRILCDHDKSWRYVNKYEQSVGEVIEIMFTYEYDEDVEKFFRAVLAASLCGCGDCDCEHCGEVIIPRPDESRTLVNLAWKNY
jgi:nuclear transport factor 2 (NTF2) superfamily protein